MGHRMNIPLFQELQERYSLLFLQLPVDTVRGRQANQYQLQHSFETDLHSMAVLIYEYLLTRHPLTGPKHIPDIPAEEEDFLLMGSQALFIENPDDRSNRPSLYFIHCPFFPRSSFLNINLTISVFLILCPQNGQTGLSISYNTNHFSLHSGFSQGIFKYLC